MLPPKREVFSARYRPARRPTHELTTTQRGYGAPWQRARLIKMHEEPYCEAIICVDCEGLVDERGGFKCSKCGKIQDENNLKRCNKPVQQVDHFVPMSEDRTLALVKSNFRSNCARHNSQKSHIDNRRGVLQDKQSDLDFGVEEC